MAKLGLLFVAVFCVVQISLAARLPRETPSSTETSFWESAKGTFGQLSDDISKTFTKENADKFIKSVSDGAKDFGNKAKELAGDVSDKISELGKDVKKEFEDKSTEKSN